MANIKKLLGYDQETMLKQLSMLSFLGHTDLGLQGVMVLSKKLLISNVLVLPHIRPFI